MFFVCERDRGKGGRENLGKIYSKLIMALSGKLGLLQFMIDNRIQ